MLVKSALPRGWCNGKSSRPTEPSNSGMQLTALRAASDAERFAAIWDTSKEELTCLELK